MKIIILFVLLSGCASISYERNGEYERLVVNSLFRSLEGLEAERNDFKISIKRVNSEVMPEDVANALRIIKLL